MHYNGSMESMRKSPEAEESAAGLKIPYLVKRQNGYGGMPLGIHIWTNRRFTGLKSKKGRR